MRAAVTVVRRPIWTEVSELYLIVLIKYERIRSVLLAMKERDQKTNQNAVKSQEQNPLIARGWRFPAIFEPKL